jgi:hypothetical protein
MQHLNNPVRIGKTFYRGEGKPSMKVNQKMGLSFLIKMGQPDVTTDGQIVYNQ